MRVAFFDEAGAGDFHPLTLARPVFELVCGRYSLRERLVRHCPVTEWGVFIPDCLAETYREAHPEAHVNDFSWLGESRTIVVNGRWLPAAETIRCDLEREGAAFIDGRPVFLAIEPADVSLVTRAGWNEAVDTLARSGPRFETPGLVIEHAWDLVRYNAVQLVEDFRLDPISAGRYETQSQVAVIGDRENLSVDPAAQIEPFVVLDARRGPITIGPGALLKSFTHITGPCHVDRGSQLFGAAIRGGTTIGPECRVGGEVEASILHAMVNKYHAGFLGHSYVCPWVNLGALTTTSDLKNDYTHIRTTVRGESVDTGLTKLGSFLGDHAKTSIGTLLNAGSSIGAMAMILPDGQLAPKYVPSFCKVARGELTDEIDLEKAIRTSRIAMARRNQDLTPAQERLWRRLHVQTRAERENAILRIRERQFGRDLAVPQ